MVGDLLMQCLEQGSLLNGYNLRRTLRFLLFRICFAVPTYTYWLRLLEALPAARVPLLAAATRAFADCGLYTPFYHLVFFATMHVWEGGTLEAGYARAFAMLPTSVPASWSFWIPVQMLTFSVVPSYMRLTFVNSVSLLWNAVMSGLNQAALERA